MPGVNTFWGKLIVQLRAEQGLSQRQLASGAKVNRSTLRLIEEGKTSGYIDSIESLFNYMGYELEVVDVNVATRLRERKDASEDPKLRSRLASVRLMKLDPELTN
jgi:transcriptional regulator with XRE-family HTH domain